jgi:hypothetical protein
LSFTSMITGLSPLGLMSTPYSPSPIALAALSASLITSGGVSRIGSVLCRPVRRVPRAAWL